MSWMMELLAATACFWIYYAVPTLLSIFVVYFTICADYWWILLPYFIWIWKDRSTSEREGRQYEWVRNWIWWKYVASYFDLKLTRDESTQLEPNRNYLFCCFPHAIIPNGALIALGTDAVEYKKLFPLHKPLICTVSTQFYVPFVRELLLSLGCVSVSAESIMYNLTSSEGGKILCVFVGGIAEASHSRPSNYKLVLKSRKGFVKIALKTGTPLVPVMSFNEVEVYDQLDVPIFSNIQKYMRKVLLYPGVLAKGRYFFFPEKVPITVVVGQPIYVEQNIAPTSEEVDKLHGLFVDRLIELFENHKHKYIENASNTHLEIV